VYEARWDKGGAEPTEDNVFFLWKSCEIQVETEKHIRNFVAEFGGCWMMYSGGVMFRMRMPQLTIKAITHWSTVCEELHFFSVTW
jgi:hypothetical protein